MRGSYPGVISEVRGNTVKLREWWAGIWCGCETLRFDIIEDAKIVGTKTLTNWNDADETLTFEPGTSLVVGRAIEFQPPLVPFKEVGRAELAKLYPNKEPE